MTKHVSLTEEPFANFQEVLVFQRFIAEKFDDSPLWSATASYLVENYGRCAQAIVENAFSDGQKTDERLVLAELRHCLEHELVRTPTDFFERRTGMLYFNIHRVRLHLEVVLRAFQSHFNWPPEQLENERADLLRLLKLVCPSSS